MKALFAAVLALAALVSVGNRRASGAMDIGCYEAAQGMMIYVR